MHFSKTYAQLLLTLPPELRENAIEYRQLKKLINQVVHELASLGLSPAVLQGLLQSANENASIGTDKGKQRAHGERPADSDSDAADDASTSPPTENLHLQPQHNRRPSSPAKAIYEFVNDGDHIEPRLRLWVGTAAAAAESTNDEGAPAAGASPTDESRVAIFLDKSESKPSSPVAESIETTLGQKHDPLSTEDLLVVSKPISKQVGHSLLWTLQRRPQSAYSEQDKADLDDGWNNASNESLTDEASTPALHPVGLVSKQSREFSDGTREIVIPLASDTAFFQLLQTALQTLNAHLHFVRADFIAALDALTRSISRSARPQSSSPGFRPYSAAADPTSVQSPVSPFSPSFLSGGIGSGNGSDLYAWREIFQLYVEAEVFESLSERNRGERSVEDSEERMALFAERVTGRGFRDARKLKSKESKKALETFLELNVLVLNLKKFQRANAEAARKILKKHAKRTALPLPMISSTNSSSLVPTSSGVYIYGQTASHADILALIPTAAASLPHILVQAIGETLLPVIPHIDDYACLICTSIAFKPIRLGCGHLFCVRCLVKMQKRGKGSCPMCRATTVLQADRSNVDWALLNFMQDWFPIEAKAKLKQNEREAAKEQMEELGLVDPKCIIA